MCLYPKFIKNRKYLPNKKNNGKPQMWKDERVKYVPVGCGKCIECRQQKAREWQTRLHEEIKFSAKSYFVTLTFTNENLQKLESILNSSECNAVAGLAVRRFLERWRKEHKKSVMHWLITELGHEGTERIHLHGIIFTNEPFNNSILERIWQYGMCYTGDYCNAHTINYVVKYMLKVDTDHIGYIPQIFCSAGIGRTYYDKNKGILHNFNGKGKYTQEYYTMPNGAKVNLPIYYRNLFFTEKQRERLWLNKLDKHEIYVRGIRIRNIDTDKGLKQYHDVLKEQQRNNIALGYGSRDTKWDKKEYNTTLRRINDNRSLQNLEKIK